MTPKSKEGSGGDERNLKRLIHSQPFVVNLPSSKLTTGSTGRDKNKWKRKRVGEKQGRGQEIAFVGLFPFVSFFGFPSFCDPTWDKGDLRLLEEVEGLFREKRERGRNGTRGERFCPPAF